MLWQFSIVDEWRYQSLLCGPHRVTCQLEIWHSPASCYGASIIYYNVGHKLLDGEGEIS